MIVRIETKIFGFFLIEKEMKVKHHPFEIDINYEENTNLNLISISRKVFNYSSFLPTIKVNNQKLKEIKFPSQDFLEEQIEILQHIESFGAIDKGIEKIDWQNCSIEWIPENEDEKKELQISKYNRDLSYGLEPKILSKDWLFNTVIHRRQLSHLALPFSFFREGANYYHSFQYQNAFINFYLMLEGFFGNGKSFKNKDMKDEFKKSTILDYAIDKTIKQFEKDENRKHNKWLVEICGKYNKEVNIEGIVHFLVEQRGNLSHFSLEKSAKQKNPFKDREYESLAFTAMTICLFSTIKLRLDPFRQKTLSR